MPEGISDASTAIKTRLFKVDRAMDFYNKSMFICIGKQSEWSDSDYGTMPVPSDKENNPPVEDERATEIIEPIGYKKIDLIHFVIPYVNGMPVPNGEQVIDYGSSEWLTISSDLAYEQGLIYVSFSVDILDTDFPLGPYRQIGLFTDLQRKDGVDSGKNILLPSEVENPGILQMIENRPARNRMQGTREHISYVLSFQ